MTIDVTVLGAGELEPLVALARRPEVVRYGEHLETDPTQTWVDWLGDADPNRQLTVAVRRRGGLACAARLTAVARRRQCHAGTLDLIAPWDGDDDAVDAALAALIRAADRWMQIDRLELVAPAGHPRIEGVFAALGLTHEVTKRDSLRRDGVYADEAVLGRIAPTAPPPGAIRPAASMPPKGPPAEVTLRPLEAADAKAFTRMMSDERVIWGTLQLPWQRASHWSGRLAAIDPLRVRSIAAVVDGELAGSISLMMHTAARRRHFGAVGMMVAPDFQGRRVGSALIDAAITQARRIGLHRVELEVFEDNPRAVRLYESRGFATEGTRARACYRDGAQLDDRVMARVGDPA